jgi:hypothetical protein
VILRGVGLACHLMILIATRIIVSMPTLIIDCVSSE